VLCAWVWVGVELKSETVVSWEFHPSHCSDSACLSETLVFVCFCVASFMCLFCDCSALWFDSPFQDIQDSLLAKLNQFYAAEAVGVFRNITGYMGDRKTVKAGAGHAHKMLKIAIAAPEEFRDEIYCQICKQTNRNPNPASNVRGWKV
jgi:hypothetical protein